jgi:hypothetical protein
MTNLELEFQYQQNVSFYNNLGNPRFIAKLLEHGTPYSSSELYKYGFNHHGDKNSKYYLCCILEDSAADCLNQQHFESLNLIVDCPRWSESSYSHALYAVFRHNLPVTVDSYKTLFDKAKLTDPNFPNIYLQDGLYSFTAKNNIFSFEDMKHIIGSVPDDNKILYWTIQGKQSYEKLQSAISFLIDNFPNNYKFYIIQDLNSVAKLEIMPDAQFELLNPIYLEHNQKNPLEFRFLVFKEIFKKFSTYKTPAKKQKL